MAKQNTRFLKKSARFTGKTLRVLLKTLGVVLLSVVTLVVAVAAFFFWTPEFSVGTETARRLVSQYLPESIQITFEEFELSLIRPDGMPFAKRLEIDSRNFCLRYEGQAVISCFENVDLAASAGWGGQRLPTESKWIPRLIQIDPIVLLGGDIAVDLPAFPENEKEPEQEGGFDVLGFVRNQVLPKWQVEGTEVDVESFVLKMEEGAGYTSRFQVVTGEKGETVRVAVEEFRSLGDPLNGRAVVNIVRPGGVFQDLSFDVKEAPTDGQRAGWKVYADADVNLDPAREIRLKADAAIPDWRHYDFRIASNFRGISELKEVRLSGAINEDDFAGLFSLKMGAATSMVRTLSFVNCALSADLADKTGALRCGPQAVTLQVREGQVLKARELYRFYPEFELRVSDIEFGEQKAANLALDLTLEHMDLVSLKTALNGTVHSRGEGWAYQMGGNLDFLLPKFQRVVKLVRGTILAIPAPLNTLDGAVALQATADVSDRGGSIEYQTATRLDSPEGQSVHLDFNGHTLLNSTQEGLSPVTNASLLIRKLVLMAPRLDLSAPPQFTPDNRFRTKAQRLADQKRDREKEQAEPSNVRLRLRTVSPGAIRIGNNLTKAPIPVSLDLIYDDREPGQTFPTPQDRDDNRTPSSVSSASMGVGDIPVVQAQNPRRKDENPHSKLTGWIQAGHTPVELFRRNATVEHVRVDLLPNGQQRLDGQVAVNYLDYAIKVMIVGTTQQPRVNFVSDPPLEENQILAVLLFGRPLEDIDEDQRGSVNTLNTQMANAVLGIGSLYFLASTPIESVAYDPERGMVMAKVGLGGGASIEVGGSPTGGTEVGFRKRLARELIFRSDVETLEATGQQSVSAFIEWVKRF